MGKMGLETPGKHPPIPNLALCAKNKPLKGNVSFQKNTFDFLCSLLLIKKNGFFIKLTRIYCKTCTENSRAAGLTAFLLSK